MLQYIYKIIAHNQIAQNKIKHLEYNIIFPLKYLATANDALVEAVTRYSSFYGAVYMRLKRNVCKNNFLYELSCINTCILIVIIKREGKILTLDTHAPQSLVG